MLVSLPVPFLPKPVLYRPMADGSALREVKAELRETGDASAIGTVAAELEPEIGGIVMRGSRIFEVRGVGPSASRGLVDMQLQLVSSDEEGDA